MEQHAGRLLLFARQQAHLAADAEDLLQESLVEAWRRTGAADPPPMALVAATIRRRAIDKVRSGDRRQRREEAVGTNEVPWFDTTATDTETRDWIETALRRLPADQREVVTLKIWGELTFAEIGTALEISPNTAASRYRYGLDKLRQELKNDGQTGYAS